MMLSPARESFARAGGDSVTIAAQHADKRAQIEARIGASPALPMFDESGRWLVDDYTDADFEEQGRGREA